MNPLVKAAYEKEMSRARQARAAGALDQAFAALERAHILGQRYLLPHVATHWQMLCIGLLRGDAREVFGQVLRLVATVPGFLTGWIPKGNTGGAGVSALRPMAPPDDLRALTDFSVWRDVAVRALVLCAVAALLLGWLAWPAAAA